MKIGKQKGQRCNCRLGTGEEGGGQLYVRN